MQMEMAWEYLQRLCRHPHRGSATAGEAAAAADLRRGLEQMGYGVQVQPFRSPRDTLYLGPCAVMAGFLAAARVGSAWPWAGLLLCLLLMAPMVGELLGSRLDFDLILPRYPSQNLIARLPGSGGGARRTVVVSAHYDTQRASYLFHPSVAPYLREYFYLVYAGLLAVPAGLGLRWAAPGAHWPGWVLGAGVLLTALNAVFLMACRRTGRYSNGANDNGSGVALLLSLAKRWAAAPRPDADLIFLLTGCEEVGTRGMKRYVRTCGLDRRATRFINLDNLGSGKLHYLAGEGMLAYKPYGPQLLAAAGEGAAEHPGRVGIRRNLLLPTDGLIPTLAGYEAITFIAFAADGSLPDYHWHTDRPGRIDRQHLAFCERFLWEYLLRCAHAPGESLTCGTVKN